MDPRVSVVPGGTFGRAGPSVCEETVGSRVSLHGTKCFHLFPPTDLTNKWKEELKPERIT